MTMQTGGFSPAYRRWAEAEDAVSEFERAIFRERHQLTQQELSCLRVLRGTAAVRLRQLISDIDDAFIRLRPGEDARLGRIAEDAASCIHHPQSP